MPGPNASGRPTWRGHRGARGNTANSASTSTQEVSESGAQTPTPESLTPRSSRASLCEDPAELELLNELVRRRLTTQSTVIEAKVDAAVEEAPARPRRSRWGSAANTGSSKEQKRRGSGAVEPGAGKATCSKEQKRRGSGTVEPGAGIASSASKTSAAAAKPTQKENSQKPPILNDLHKLKSEFQVAKAQLQTLMNEPATPSPRPCHDSCSPPLQSPAHSSTPSRSDSPMQRGNSSSSKSPPPPSHSVSPAWPSGSSPRPESKSRRPPSPETPAIHQGGCHESCPPLPDAWMIHQAGDNDYCPPPPDAWRISPADLRVEGQTDDYVGFLRVAALPDEYKSPPLAEAGLSPKWGTGACEELEAERLAEVDRKEAERLAELAQRRQDLEASTAQAKKKSKDTLQQKEPSKKKAPKASRPKFGKASKAKDKPGPHELAQKNVSPSGSSSDGAGSPRELMTCDVDELWEPETQPDPYPQETPQDASDVIDEPLTQTFGEQQTRQEFRKFGRSIDSMSTQLSADTRGLAGASPGENVDRIRHDLELVEQQLAAARSKADRIEQQRHALLEEQQLEAARTQADRIEQQQHALLERARLEQLEEPGGVEVELGAPCPEPSSASWAGPCPEPSSASWAGLESEPSFSEYAQDSSWAILDGHEQTSRSSDPDASAAVLQIQAFYRGCRARKKAKAERARLSDSWEKLQGAEARIDNLLKEFGGERPVSVNGAAADNLQSRAVPQPRVSPIANVGPAPQRKPSSKRAQSSAAPKGKTNSSPGNSKHALQQPMVVAEDALPKPRSADASKTKRNTPQATPGSTPVGTPRGAKAPSKVETESDGEAKKQPERTHRPSTQEIWDGMNMYPRARKFAKATAAAASAASNEHDVVQESLQATVVYPRARRSVATTDASPRLRKSASASKSAPPNDAEAQNEALRKKPVLKPSIKRGSLAGDVAAPPNQPGVRARGSLRQPADGAPGAAPANQPGVRARASSQPAEMDPSNLEDGHHHEQNPVRRGSSLAGDVAAPPNQPGVRARASLRQPADGASGRARSSLKQPMETDPSDLEDGQRHLQNPLRRGSSLAGDVAAPPNQPGVRARASLRQPADGASGRARSSLKQPMETDPSDLEDGHHNVPNPPSRRSTAQVVPVSTNQPGVRARSSLKPPAETISSDLEDTSELTPRSGPQAHPYPSYRSSFRALQAYLPAPPESARTTPPGERPPAPTRTPPRNSLRTPPRTPPRRASQSGTRSGSRVRIKPPVSPDDRPEEPPPPPWSSSKHAMASSDEEIPSAEVSCSRIPQPGRFLQAGRASHVNAADQTSKRSSVSMRQEELPSAESESSSGEELVVVKPPVKRNSQIHGGSSGSRQTAAMKSRPSGLAGPSSDEMARALPDGQAYMGFHNKNGGREGFGVMRGEDGQMYSGQWQDGKRNGQGTLFFENGVFEGQWVDDYAHGFGTISHKNGDIFKGEYKDNQKCGPGTYIWKDGSEEKGDYLDGKRHGWHHLCRDGEEWDIRYEKGDMVSANKRGSAMPAAVDKPAAVDPPLAADQAKQQLTGAHAVGSTGGTKSEQAGLATVPTDKVLKSTGPAAKPKPRGSAPRSTSTASTSQHSGIQKSSSSFRTSGKSLASGGPRSTAKGALSS